MTGAMDRSVLRPRLVPFVASLLCFSAALHAQPSATELSAAAANPLADLISLPFQNNTDFGLGPFDRATNVLNIQPVVPLLDGKLITRTIFPFVRIPDIGSETGTISSGMSDINFTAFYVFGKGPITWGAGPIAGFPTGGDLRGSKKWTLGPSFVVLAQPGPWTLGLLVNNVWSYAGDADRDPVNRGLIQYFIVRQLGNGWYLSSSPIINVNWKADEGQKWIVPFGLGAGKVLFVGQLPLNVQAGAYYNVVKPDVGPNWQFRLQAQVLLPTSMFRGRNP
jgi:hypothetical protein